MGTKANFKNYAPVVIIGLATITVICSVFGEGSYQRLVGLRAASERQEESNQELRLRVEELKSSVSSLRSGGRALEKAARNELGLVRPNEQIFIFENRN